MDEAVKSVLDHGGPYQAEKVGPYGWWCVTDSAGSNVLSFKGSTRKFTDQDDAEKIAEEWNKNG